MELTKYFQTDEPEINIQALIEVGPSKDCFVIISIDEITIKLLFPTYIGVYNLLRKLHSPIVVANKEVE